MKQCIIVLINILPVEILLCCYWSVFHNSVVFKYLSMLSMHSIGSN